MLDVFMQINGIPGESKDANHTGWIELLSVGYAVSRPVAIGTGAGGDKKAEQRAKLTELDCTKYTDVSSVKLWQACLLGTKFDTVTIEFCRAGGDKLMYKRLTLTDVIITAYTNSVRAKGDDSLPIEILKLSFAKITFEYVQQAREDGIGRGTMSAGWSLPDNAPV